MVSFQNENEICFNYKSPLSILIDTHVPEYNFLVMLGEHLLGNHCDPLYPHIT